MITHSLGRRILALLAESAAICAEAEECRLESQHLRRQLAEIRQTARAVEEEAPLEVSQSAAAGFAPWQPPLQSPGAEGWEDESPASA